jgi:Zn-dependent protease
MDLHFTIIGIVVVIGSILISMTLHEAMHAYVSNWLGDDTARVMGRLTLNPAKHIDPVNTILMPVILYMLIGIPFGAAKPVPFNPNRLKYDEFGAALVGIAGPLTNLFLGIVSGFILRFGLGLESSAITNGVFLFMIVNLSFFVFNMIPFPPLDGSRLMYALAPEPIQNIMRTIERGGITYFFVFIILFYQFVAPVIGNVVLLIASLILGVNIGR